MIPGLIGLYALRDHLDRAIAALEPIQEVIRVWQESAAQAPERPPPGPADEADALSGAPRRNEAPSEPGPTPANGGNGADPGDQASCEFCGATFVRDRGPGARRRYCGASCRAKASEARARQREQEAEAGPGLEPLPAEVERSPAMFSYPDDPRSDATLLRPPPLAWEEPAS